MFNNIKINRYKLYKNIEDKINSEEGFDSIDNFKNDLEDYIYTKIKLTDHTEPIEKAFQSRLQLLQSETILRGLMLKEGMVVALNNNNFPTYYAALKSFLEIPAVLGYVADLIYNNNDYDEIIPKINILHLGNRDAGSLTMITDYTKAVNVMTMFTKLDKFLKDVACSGKPKAECDKIIKNENVMTSVYSDVCNFGHTNFNANLSIGILHKDVWEAKKDSSGYKRELWAFYMTGFLIGIDIIEMLCGMISKNEKVQNFNLLNNPNYF